MLLTLTLVDFPPIKPSAIALGVVFKTTSKFLVGIVVEGTVHHEEIKEYLSSDQKTFKDPHGKTTADAISYRTSGIISSAFQTYAIGALLSTTGTLSNRGAIYVGALVYFASSVPGVSRSSSATK